MNMNMRNLCLFIGFILLSFVFVIPTKANQNLLTNIANNKYKAKEINDLFFQADGESYTLLQPNGQSLVKYDIKTGAVIDTLIRFSQLKENKIEKMESYQISADESKILFYTNKEELNRRSFLADYYIYNIKEKRIEALSENGKQQMAIFSPNGRIVAFARNNNLFLKKLDYGTEIAVTTDGELGNVINGTPDWVYQEEFACKKLFEFSPDSKMLAFVRFDENKVNEYCFELYPEITNQELFNPSDLYTKKYCYKYPKAGTANATVSVQVYDVFYKSTKQMNIESPEEIYIPRIKWTQSSEELAIITLNRSQNKMELILANPKSTVCKPILVEKTNKYINVSNLDFITFLPNNQFVYVNDKSGFNRMYVYSNTGILVKEINNDDFDLTNFYGYDATKGLFYYQSAEPTPLQRNIYSIDLKAKKTKLSNENGVHNASFSTNFEYYIDDFSSANTPNIISIYNSSENKVQTLENNEDLKSLISSDSLQSKEFFSFSTSENVQLNAWMMKPKNFDEKNQYPLLMIQYSGPNSQKVMDKWEIGWEQYLVDNGYIVVCVDGRGTGGRGSDFRNCTYLQLGILEAQDQIEAARYLSSLAYVNKDRIGIFGWSFGGYTTLMCMSLGNGIFKAGIAVAPITDWRFYDTAYTERYMKRPQENMKKYKQSSPLEMADKLQGNLLIIHGTADDNVHLQNTLAYTKRLTEANKEFEMQLYTNSKHDISVGNDRIHLYNKMMQFLLKKL